MADDWKPGDLALCVHDRQWLPSGATYRAPDQCSPIKSAFYPRVGSKWRVAKVEIHSMFDCGETRDLVYLGLEGQPSDIGFDARCFRKIDEHQADAEDDETIRLLTSAPETVTA